MSDWIGTAEIQKIIRVSRSQVTNLLRSGHIPAEKRGRYWYAKRSDVLAFKQQFEKGAPDPRLDDRVTMATLYEDLGTLRNLARELGCCHATARKALHMHGIPITNRRQAATPRFSPRTVTVERWMDVAIILLRRGIKPQRPVEMCPPNCPGRADCLDTDRCVLDRNGKLKDGRTA